MQIASPVCWQFGEKILKICAAKLKPHLLDMSIAIYDCPKMVAHICKTASPMVLYFCFNFYIYIEYTYLAYTFIKSKFGHPNIENNIADHPFMPSSAINLTFTKPNRYLGGFLCCEIWVAHNISLKSMLVIFDITHIPKLCPVCNNHISFPGGRWHYFLYNGDKHRYVADFKGLSRCINIYNKNEGETEER